MVWPGSASGSWRFHLLVKDAGKGRTGASECDHFYCVVDVQLNIATTLILLLERFLMRDKIVI